MTSAFAQNAAEDTTTPDNNPIEHIVVIMQENRSFDHYFGTYPGANGIPEDACMPINPKYPENGCIRPFPSTADSSHEMPHTFQSSEIAYNEGKMDGFMVAERNFNTMSHYDNKTIPYYWDLAKHYVLADNFFSSALGYSLPNHWYAIAGQAPTISIYDALKANAAILPGVNGTNDVRIYNPGGILQGLANTTGKDEDVVDLEYLEEANHTMTVANLFENSSISWKYYDHSFDVSYKKAVQSGSAYDYWNPFAAKASSYTDDYHPHFVNRSEIFSDLKTGKLPQVSWVIPSIPISEHPPFSIKKGMIWVTDVVNAIMNSTYWNNTAIIITWDDYGGFYDHVAPPKEDNFGLSFRVPALIVSPYSKPGYIDHTLYSFESMLKFIEWRFGLPSLTYRDAHANNLLNAFDFNQKPNPPHIIPLSKQELESIVPFIEHGKEE
jgi:phospholipase C